MNIHLSGSFDQIDSLRTITDIIHAQGSMLTYNWIDPEIIRRKDKVAIEDWTPHVQNNLEAISRSDLVIIEATSYSFSQGFQVAAALDNKKPVLVLSEESLKHRYISGFTNPLLVHKNYSNQEELAKLVSSFLKKNTIHTKDLRFNFFITRMIQQYIDEQALLTNKSRSEIIRDVLKKQDRQRDSQ